MRLKTTVRCEKCNHSWDIEEDDKEKYFVIHVVGIHNNKNMIKKTFDS